MQTDRQTGRQTSRHRQTDREEGARKLIWIRRFELERKEGEKK